MIVKAEKKHIPLILKRLSELEHPPNENEDSIVNYINEPRSSIFVDEKKGLLCRVHVQFEGCIVCVNRPPKENVHIAWLLPMTLPLSNLNEILGITLTDIFTRYPQAKTFYTWARFKTGKGCLKEFTVEGADEEMVKGWQSLFPSCVIEKPSWNWRFGGGWFIHGILEDIIKDFNG